MKIIKNKIFAYVRVSTKEQNINRQIEAIKEYCIKENIVIDERDFFIDRISGKNFERPKYQSLKHMVRSSDVIIIKELDRLGRNKDEIKQELEYFKDMKVQVRILNIPTTLINLSEFKESNWIFDMINNILIEVLGAMAEEEREKIRARQKEGIESAKAKGKYLGRPRIELPCNFSKAYDEWRAGERTAVETMKQLNLKKATFYRLVKQYETKTHFKMQA